MEVRSIESYDNLEFYETPKGRDDAITSLVYNKKPRWRNSKNIKSYSDLVPKLTELGKQFKCKLIYDYLRLLHYSAKQQDFPVRVTWKKFLQKDIKGWPIKGSLPNLQKLSHEQYNKIIEKLDNIELEETFFEISSQSGHTPRKPPRTRNPPKRKKLPQSPNKPENS